MDKDHLSKNLISNLERLLAESSLNLRELAGLTKIPVSTLYSIITGSSNDPKLSTLYSISTFFNVNISQLVGEVSLNINEINIPILSWNKINSQKGCVEFDINSTTKFISVECRTKNPMFALYANNNFSYKYKEDSLVIIEISQDFKNGDIILLSINRTNPIFKKAIVEGQHTYLESISYDIPIEKYNNDYKVFGIVREIRISS